MTDRFGREIDYLRLSVTDRCNLRCRYCMPDGVTLLPHADQLTYEELLRVAALAVTLGVDRFKVTGGEPLVRRGCVDFIARLKALAGVAEVTLTTNGLLLDEALDALCGAGLDAVNVSLDTLDAGLYARLTGCAGVEGRVRSTTETLPAAAACQESAHAAFDARALFARGREDASVRTGAPCHAAVGLTCDAPAAILRAVDRCIARGLRTKLNVVLLNENLDELPRLAALAAERPLDVRFIELMPIGEGASLCAPSADAALSRLQAAFPDLRAVDEHRGNGPARYFASAALQGRIGLIDAVSHRFCERCNRVRLTSVGRLKPCLCYDTSVDLRAPLRSGATDDELRTILRDAIFAKPRAHCFDERAGVSEPAAMNQIGG